MGGGVAGNCVRNSVVSEVLVITTYFDLITNPIFYPVFLLLALFRPPA